MSKITLAEGFLTILRIVGWALLMAWCFHTGALPFRFFILATVIICRIEIHGAKLAYLFIAQFYRNVQLKQMAEDLKNRAAL